MLTQLTNSLNVKMTFVMILQLEVDLTPCFLSNQVLSKRLNLFLKLVENITISGSRFPGFFVFQLFYGISLRCKRFGKMLLNRE